MVYEFLKIIRVYTVQINGVSIVAVPDSGSDTVAKPARQLGYPMQI